MLRSRGRCARGCSNNRETNNVPVQYESGGDAIHVRGRAGETCWDDAVDGTGVALFDAVMPAVEGEYCANATRRFANGYSSGSFMAHRLARIRADMLRGVATIAGGHGCDPVAPHTPTDHPPCEEYAGCAAYTPVVWCQTSGQNHARQDSLATPAFWDFLSVL